MNTGKLWRIIRRTQCKISLILPAGEGLEVGAGGKATQPRAQELRAAVARHRDLKKEKEE